jgi:hypothetical protein
VIEEELLRVYTNLMDRISGPLHLRLLIQPMVALVLATLAGLKDARSGKTPYFWGLTHDPEHRREMLENGWHSIGKLFVVALILDCVYQYIALRFVWPGEAIIVAIVLAIIPYVLVRSLVTRLFRKPA